MRSKTFLLNLEKYKKLQEILEKNNNIKINLNHINTYTGNRKFVCCCSYCGREYISGSPSGNNCLNCSFEFKCIDCNEFFELSKRYIDFNNLNSLLNLKCSKCEKTKSRGKLKEPGQCTKCGQYSTVRNHYGYCKNCTEEYSKPNIEKYKK